MSTLSITYTPQYLGPHRICYRLQDIPSPDLYCCLVDASPSVVGVPKTFVITISDPPCASVPGIDPESCVNQIYEGYVQPECEAELSLVNRIPWTVTFTPDPSCVSRLICCQEPDGLTSLNITIINPGNQYNIGLSPILVTVVRDALDPVPPGGLNDAVVSIVITGITVTSILVTTPGLYGVQPTFIVPAPTLGGPGPVTAILQANIQCPGLDRYYIDCVGTDRTTQLGINQCVVFCMPKATPYLYTDPAHTIQDTFNYSYTNQGCCNCSTCRNYTITLLTPDNVGPVDVNYTVCSNSGKGNQTAINNMTPGVPEIINCMLPNTIYAIDYPNATFTIIDNGPCITCP